MTLVMCTYMSLCVLCVLFVCLFLFVSSSVWDARCVAWWGVFETMLRYLDCAFPPLSLPSIGIARRSVSSIHNPFHTHNSTCLVAVDSVDEVADAAVPLVVAAAVRQQANNMRNLRRTHSHDTHNNNNKQTHEHTHTHVHIKKNVSDMLPFLLVSPFIVF